MEQLEYEGSTDPRAPRGRRTVALAAVACLAVLAAAVVAIEAQRADEGEVASVTAAAPVRYFVLGGMGPEWRAFVVPGDGVFPGVRMQLFGHPERDDPFAKGDAFVVTTSVNEGAGWSVDGERVSVRGQPAALQRGQRDPWGPVDVLRYRADSLLVTVYSKQLGRDGLLSFADALDPGSLSLTREVRDLRPLGDGDDLPIPASPGYRRQRIEYFGLGRVSLSAQPGGRESLRSLRWFGGESTTVEGRPAMRYRAPGVDGDGPHSYAWQLEDGTVLSIEVNGAAVDPLALASTVREVTAAEWSSMRGPVAAVYNVPIGAGVDPSGVAPATTVGGTGPVRPDTSMPPVVSTRTGEVDGVTWTFEDRGPLQCLRLQAGSFNGSSCEPVSPPTSTGGSSPRFGRMFATADGVLFVMATPPTTRSLRVTLADGGAPTASRLFELNDGTVLYLVRLPRAGDGLDGPSSMTMLAGMRATATLADGSQRSVL